MEMIARIVLGELVHKMEIICKKNSCNINNFKFESTMTFIPNTDKTFMLNHVFITMQNVPKVNYKCTMVHKLDYGIG